MDSSALPHCRRLRVLVSSLETRPAAANPNRRLVTGPATPGEGYGTIDLRGRVVSNSSRFIALIFHTCSLHLISATDVRPWSLAADKGSVVQSLSRWHAPVPMWC